MNLTVHAEVDGELEQAARWYDKQQFGLGAEFLELVDEAFARVKANAASFARLETVRTRRDIRRCLLRRFPYYVVYENLPDRTVILAATIYLTHHAPDGRIGA